MRTILAAALFLALMPVDSPALQQPIDGQPVRVEVADPFEGTVTRLGTVEHLRGDTIWVRTKGQVLRLDTREADPHVPVPNDHGKAGAGWGFGIGVIAGAVIGYLSYEPDYRDVTRCEQRPGAMMGSLYGATCRTVGQVDSGWRPLSAIVGAGVGAAAGSVLGYVVGSTIRDWIPIGNADLGVAPTGISVSLKH